MILRTKKKKSGPKHCKATTKNGRQCKNHPVGGASYCHVHKKELTLNVTCVVQEVATDRLKSCMKSMLDTTLFWKHLEKERKKTPFKKAEFAICIKVDLDVFNAGSSTGTCPSVVETLIELLHDRGYFSVAVADSMASSSSWLENRDVLVVADLIGYQYQTSDGKPYDVVNLSDDCVGDIFPETHFLHLLRLSRYWTEANFRICFSKNKTDDE
ncbi:MAG: DUF362 domain-containing protein, partial [Nitrospinota bacterium]